MTFAETIEEVANGQPILGVAIKPFRTYAPSDKPIGELPYNTVLHWADARPHLNYEWDSGFGGANCHAITAWTKDRVIFVHEYDGSTGVNWVPRNMTNHEPEYGGLS